MEFIAQTKEQWIKSDPQYMRRLKLIRLAVLPPEVWTEWRKEYDDDQFKWMTVTAVFAAARDCPVQ